MAPWEKVVEVAGAGGGGTVLAPMHGRSLTTRGLTHHGFVGNPLAGVVEQDALALGREGGAAVRAAHEVAQVGPFERSRVLLEGRPCRRLVNCCFTVRSFRHFLEG